MSIVTGIRSILLINPMYHGFWIRQQAYDKNWSLCNILAERNRSIKEECEGII
ncbi:MAG: hypothetical protein IJN54_16815 [Lachnospiraceae bacterium]|nr:hypothetical protein [Lachnospiraceae bacterium]